jgi:4'-phosphopantetheinyl transferase EntD
MAIDAEPDHRLPAGVLYLVALPDEVANWELKAAWPNGPAWDRLLFCAKETVYKGLVTSLPDCGSGSSSRGLTLTPSRGPSGPISS